MDAKVTLSFDKEIIEKAKEYAAANNMSLSRLVEYLLNKTLMAGHGSLEEYPISDWVSQVAEGRAEYHTRKRSRKDLKDEFFSSRKK